jgi:predicted metal-dependent phosphotriesterase family hydrolase
VQFSRRAFVSALAASLGTARTRAWQPARSVAPTRASQTVLGPASPETLGPTLIHEHLLVDFVGADRVSRSRYDREQVFARALPYLEQARAQGLHTLVECTPAWLGRDPELLRRLSQASGVAIVTNTGYYGAANDKFVPAHAYTESAVELSLRWIDEAKDGIEATGIRPGFMKIGVDAGRLSEIDAKLVRAAALTHRATGLRIHSHTGDGVAAVGQLDLLGSMGVPADAFVWVHAQNEKDRDVHVAVARQGAWVEFDGVSDDSLDEHVSLVLHMRAQGLLGHILMSHDAGWYHVGEPNGGTFRPFTTMFERFLPRLRQAGLSAAEKRQLIVDNPRAVLVPAVTV